MTSVSAYPSIEEIGSSLYAVALTTLDSIDQTFAPLHARDRYTAPGGRRAGAPTIPVVE